MSERASFASAWPRVMARGMIQATKICRPAAPAMRMHVISGIPCGRMYDQKSAS